MRRVFVLIALLAAVMLSAQVASAAEVISKAVDITAMDTTASPCDDFWTYANANWFARNQIPAEYSSWSVTHEMYERNNTILREICESAAGDSKASAGSARQKIGSLYRVAMDTAKINADHAKPLESEFAYIAALKSPSDIQNAIMKYHRAGYDFLFDLSVDQDMKNPQEIILYASQSGLGLPDRDYYTREDDETKQIRAAYVQHVAKVLKLLGDSDAAAQAQAEKIMAMETRLANASLTNVEMRDPAVWYNIKTIEQANQATPNFNWTSYFGAMDQPQIKSFSIFPDKFFADVNIMLTELPMADWQSYFRWHLVHQAAPYLSSDFVNENFSFYSATLSGVKELRPRWKRVLVHIENAIGESLGELYVEKTFPPAAKQKAQDMVKNLLAAMGDRINGVDWMSAETKTAALKKLSTFTVKVGYPDKFRDYSKLEITSSMPYLEMIQRGRAFEAQRQLDKVGKPVDRGEWGMTPQTINAYYNPLMNEIVFPAAILQPPAFDPNADDASNYGAIGAIIGHEITHGFDDMGSQFAHDGSYQNWWTEADMQQFKSRTQMLVDQFNKYVVVDSMTINGQLTLGENIADLGGLIVGYYGLQKALEGKPRTMIDGFTPEQRYFLAFASDWRTMQRPEALKLQINTDPHSPAEFRVRGPLANMPEFQKAFGCGEDAKMMRSPESIVRIW